METDKIQTIRQWLATGSINIFGMPFAGKDTQAARLAEFFDAPVISGGQILREGNIPQKVRDIMDQGQLIPTKDYLDIIPPYLALDKYKGKALLLSSIGRWDGEQEAVMQATVKAGHPTKAVVFLTIDEKEAHKRWVLDQESRTRGVRADDSEESFKKRFTEYRQKTMPVIEYYRSLGLLVEIDGLPDKDTVTNQILEQLFNRASA